jgi:hypothetical protein
VNGVSDLTSNRNAYGWNPTAPNGIIDRLHVRPAAAMSDDGIRDYLRKASLQEPAFEDVAIVERHAGSDVRVRDPLRHSPICGQITTASSTRT